MAINDLIREALDRLGWKLDQLADATGVKRPTASRWASGKSIPEPWRWPTIEEALELDPGALARAFYGSEISPPDPELAAIVEQARQDHLELAEIVRDLSLRVLALERRKGGGSGSALPGGQ